jgi:hypothetical protein
VDGERGFLLTVFEVVQKSNKKIWMRLEGITPRKWRLLELSFFSYVNMLKKKKNWMPHQRDCYEIDWISGLEEELRFKGKRERCPSIIT